MPKIYEHDKNILEAEERRRTFTLLYKIMEIICVSANVRQCNVSLYVLCMHVQLCFFKIFFIWCYHIVFMSARVAAN